MSDDPKMLARLDRLDHLLDKLCFALIRRGTERDGMWGWPSLEDELREIREALGRQEAPNPPSPSLPPMP